MNLLQQIPNKKLFVFDVDWVIIDSVDIYKDAVKFVCEELWYPQLNSQYAELAKDIHYEKRIFPWDLIKHANKLFKDYVNEVEEPENFPLFPWCEDLLNVLSSYWKDIAFFSSKSKDWLDSVLSYNWIDSQANIIVSRDCVAHHKPSPEGLFLIHSKLWIDINDTIMFWDADVDLQAAKSAGIDFVGVNTGTNTSLDWEKQWVTHIASIAEIERYI